MTHSNPTRVSAELFDGQSLLAQPVCLELDGEAARVVGAEAPAAFALSSLRVSPRVFNAQRFVALPNGWELVCAEQPALARLPQASSSEGPVAWLEQRISVAVFAVLATIAGVVAFYFVGLPRLADAVATRIPPERERTFGEGTLRTFDTNLTRPTSLDTETLRQVRAGFDDLREQLTPASSARLEVRDSPGIGPNAFALPGGVIIITDQLILTCSVDESIAILAHELGHVRYRHALRHLIQESGVAALGTLVGADASSASLSASMLPIVIAQAQYSQGFEAEADAAGFAMLRRAGWSPALFASCLGKIAARGKLGDPGIASYASSHPPEADRIARAEAAARGFVPSRPPKRPADRVEAEPENASAPVPTTDHE
jgi:predicted Zn-dependent protease